MSIQSGLAVSDNVNVQVGVFGAGVQLPIQTTISDPVPPALPQGIAFTADSTITADSTLQV